MKHQQYLRKAIGALLLSFIFVGCATTPNVPSIDAVHASPTLPALAAVTPAPPSLSAGVSEARAHDSLQDFFEQTQLEEIARRAALIVIGHADEQHSAMLPPGSPLAPPEPPGERVSHPMPYTETSIAIERILKGEARGSTLHVRTLGGEVNGIGAAVTHQAQLRTGQRVVLFLKQIEPEYYVVLGEDGVYEILNDEAIGPRHRFRLHVLLARIERGNSIP